MDFATKSEISERIYRKWALSGQMVSEPFALIDSPRCKLSGFFTIGPVIYNIPFGWFDIKIFDENHYREVNRMLREVCAELRLNYLDCSDKIKLPTKEN
jgi:hypothetical protein